VQLLQREVVHRVGGVGDHHQRVPCDGHEYQPGFLGAPGIRGPRARGNVDRACQRLVDAVDGVEGRDFQMAVASGGERICNGADQAFGTDLVTAHHQCGTG